MNHSARKEIIRKVLDRYISYLQRSNNQVLNCKQLEIYPRLHELLSLRQALVIDTFYLILLNGLLKIISKMPPLLALRIIHILLRVKSRLLNN